jgi:hemolysin activation/secretion protein
MPTKLRIALGWPTWVGLLCLWLEGAHAAGPVNLDASTLLKQIPQSTPISPETSAHLLSLPTPTDEPAVQSLPFRVAKIQITGNRSIDTAQLHALVQDAEGQDLTLQTLNKTLARITDFYRQRGFPLARATLPPQTMVNGVVQVHIIEAQYGAIVLNLHPAVDSPMLRSTLSGLVPGHAIAQAPLDQTLLWLADIPGIQTSAALKPGAKLGDADLDIHAEPLTGMNGMTGLTGLAKWSGNTVLDNYGNPSLGAARAFQSFKITDPFNRYQGTTFDLNALSSGSGLNYGRIGAETILNHAAWRAGGALSSLQYTLIGRLAASSAFGTAQVAQVWTRNSVWRSDAQNMSVQLQLEDLKLRDHVGEAIVNRRAARKVVLSLKGDVQDLLMRDAFTEWNASVTRGKLRNSQQDDAWGAVTDLEKQFTKFNADASRLQHITPQISLYAGARMQWTGQRLDASEKIVIGGVGSVRALGAGALSGDQGAVLTMEYRHKLGATLAGNWQFNAFVDSAWVQQRSALPATDATHSQVSGAGLGLLWSGIAQTTVKLQMARVLGSILGLPVGETGAILGWLELTKVF